MASEDLTEILARVQMLHPRKIDLSLERIARLLEALGRPQDRLPPTLHIAGTNGKGSTVAFLRAILEASGARVHVYTSPHLVRFNERIRLAGRLVDDDALIAALAACESANAGAPITFFEITTAAAFLLFAQNPADWLVLETGLGGRVDATNVVVNPAAALIASISLDHVEFLGEAIGAIAFEKAGVFKFGRPVFSAPQPLDAQNVLIREAAKKSAPLTLGERDYFFRNESGRFIFEDENGLLDLPAPRLAGRHQFENAALAIACLRAVAPAISEQAFGEGLRRVSWPGRLQPLTRGRLPKLCPPGAELWLDGGHNRDGGLKLAAAAGEWTQSRARPLVMICAFLGNKDVRGFLEPFAGLAETIIAVPLPGDHYACSPADIVAIARELGLFALAERNVESALARLASAFWPTAPRILICGSLYLAGAILEANGDVLT